MGRQEDEIRATLCVWGSGESDRRREAQEQPENKVPAELTLELCWIRNMLRLSYGWLSETSIRLSSGGIKHRIWGRRSHPPHLERVPIHSRRVPTSRGARLYQAHGKRPLKVLAMSNMVLMNATAVEDLVTFPDPLNSQSQRVAGVVTDWTLTAVNHGTYQEPHGS